MYNHCILYGRQIGMLDIRGIKRYHQQGFASDFELFCKIPLNSIVYKAVEELTYIKVNITSKPSKTARQFYKLNDNSFIARFDEFGDRPMMLDPL